MALYNSYIMVMLWLLLWLLRQPGERLCYGHHNMDYSLERINCVFSSYGSSYPLLDS